VDRSLSAQTSEQVRRILEAAERSAAELRATAGQEAGEQVARVAKAAHGMLERITELERELEALRGGAERLAAGLAELQSRVEGESAAAAAPVPADPLPAANGESDEAGARLIALNMALGGSPREETARYLAEHFALADPAPLLDDVYARAGR
jgi:cell division septum initiation protein DivIVA